MTEGGINGNVWFENIRLIPQGGASVPAITRTYYHAGAQSVAVRVAGDPNAANNGLFWLLGDHLGSTSKTASIGGTDYVWNGSRGRN